MYVCVYIYIYSHICERPECFPVYILIASFASPASAESLATRIIGELEAER